MDDVVALAERAGAPVITTFKAKGQIADDHPLACGVLGRSGTPVASWVMNEADLLVVLGASFSNHTGIYRGHPIVQVDLDPLQLGKFHKVDVPVWGEVGVTSRAIAAALPGEPPPHRVDQRPQVAERQAIWRAEKASRRRDDRGHGVASANVFDSLSRLTPGGHGHRRRRRQQHVLLRALLRVQARPARADVRLPRLDRLRLPGGDRRVGRDRGEPVLAVTGDGGFGQYMGEILTAVKHNMNITHVLLNNGQLGKISKEQQAGSWDVWETSLHNPDFCEYARICGALGIRVTDAAQLDDAIAPRSRTTGPALVEIVTDAELI